MALTLSSLGPVVCVPESNFPIDTAGSEKSSFRIERQAANCAARSNNKGMKKGRVPCVPDSDFSIVAARRKQGTISIERDFSYCGLCGFLQNLRGARFDVPKADRPVAASGSNDFLVWADSCRIDVALMPREYADRLPCFEVPCANGPVRATCNYGPSLWAKRN